jgi:hypothetical protein
MPKKLSLQSAKGQSGAVAEENLHGVAPPIRGRPMNRRRKIVNREYPSAAKNWASEKILCGIELSV